jgi:hypothetical protein
MAMAHEEPPSFNIFSSPLSDPPSSDNALRPIHDGPETRQYRSTKELPFELAQHVQTYYEETLFTQAFEFLTSVVSNSISASNKLAPILMPGPPHLALAATMTVHPAFTTRTTAREKWNQANAALRLLRLILDTAGPVNANLVEAFRFTKYDGRTSRMSGGGGYDDDDEDQPATTFKIRYATTDSLFTHVDDCWSVVGWAFNCSCLPDMYATRWAYYEIFLTFMLNALETDWQLHYAANTPEESLIWHFIELASGGHGRSRRIIRAIFADGSTRSLNEFREVFHNELKPPKDDSKNFKQRTVDVDIDKDEFGDYLAADDSDVSASENETSQTKLRPSKRARTRTPSRRQTPRSSNESLHSAYNDDSMSPTASSTLGPPASLRLRMCLLHLLSYVSSHPTLLSTSPTTFPDLDDLYTLFVEFIKPLPLSIFTQVVLPSTSADVMSLDAGTTLAEMLLQRLLESAAPSEREDNFLTLAKLCECYAPYAAGGTGKTVDQAKVGLLIEALVRRCKAAGMLEGLLDHTSEQQDSGGSRDEDRVEEENGPEEQSVTKAELLASIEKGITRREDRADDYKTRRREVRKGKSGIGGQQKDTVEDEAWKWLKESGARMRMVLNTLA